MIKASARAHNQTEVGDMERRIDSIDWDHEFDDHQETLHLTYAPGTEEHHTDDGSLQSVHEHSEHHHHYLRRSIVSFKEKVAHLPARIDWREKGVIGQVYNQGIANII